jgi:hypothetical protein
VKTARAGAGIAAVDRARRRFPGRAAQAPQAFAGADHLGAEGAHRGRRVEDVLGFQQALYLGFARGEAAQDQGAVRDRFVAGHHDMAT